MLKLINMFTVQIGSVFDTILFQKDFRNNTIIFFSILYGLYFGFYFGIPMMLELSYIAAAVWSTILLVAAGIFGVKFFILLAQVSVGSYKQVHKHASKQQINKLLRLNLIFNR